MIRAAGVPDRDASPLSARTRRVALIVVLVLALFGCA